MPLSPPQEDAGPAESPAPRWSSGMHDAILPRGVAVKAVSGDLDAPLFPEEEDAISRAVEKRRREFIAGRACARAALEALGIQPCAIPRGSRGAPQWPPGIVGSITHCKGYRACAVAWSSELLGIGIDAEPSRPLPFRLQGGRIASTYEWVRIAELAQQAPEVNWDRMLFSAKEAIFKAWFPLTDRWLGFEDVVVEFDLAKREFYLSITVDDPPPAAALLGKARGRWIVRDGTLMTAIAVSRPERVD